MRLDQVSQRLIQSDLENLQGWRLHHVFRQPLPGLDGEEVSLQVEPLLFQLMPMVSNSVMHHCEKSESIFLQYSA